MERFQKGKRFRVSGFRVQGSGFRVQGSGFRVQGSGLAPRGGAPLILYETGFPYFNISLLAQ